MTALMRFLFTYEQVRQPIYTAGVGHWLRFEPWLGSLVEAVNLVGSYFYPVLLGVFVLRRLALSPFGAALQALRDAPVRAQASGWQLFYAELKDLWLRDGIAWGRLAPLKVFATLKHMTGHGQPESGTNIGPAPISERELRSNFLPPFEQVVRRTGISAVMPSYNEIDGVPSHANRWLLTDVLRGEWGFKGVVVSDYYAIEQMADVHHIAVDAAHALGRRWLHQAGEGRVDPQRRLGQGRLRIRHLPRWRRCQLHSD